MTRRIEQQHVQKHQAAYEIQERAPVSDRYENSTNSDIPALEWIIGTAGFVLVTALIVFLFYHAITQNQSPPDVVVSVTSITQIRSGYLVMVKTLNHGNSTAAEVGVQGELRNGPELLEQSHATLDYLPPYSEKSLGLFFTRDPRQFDLAVRALGYVEP
jgi:uncharacterized protein (TIGR02588 family)